MSDNAGKYDASGCGRSVGQRLLFCKGLDAADDFLRRWTREQQQQQPQQKQQSQQQQQQQQQQQRQQLHDLLSCHDDASASDASRSIFPFENMSSEELQAVTTITAQVLLPPFSHSFTCLL